MRISTKRIQTALIRRKMQRKWSSVTDNRIEARERRRRRIEFYRMLLIRTIEKRACWRMLPSSRYASEEERVKHLQESGRMYIE